MIQPLLHLLLHGKLDRLARTRLVAEMLAAGGSGAASGVPQIQEVLYLADANVAGELDRLIRHYPELRGMRTIPIGDARPFRHLEASATGRPALLFVAPGAANAIQTVLDAMAAGVLVLVPDDDTAQGLVLDGITGFHYRAHDPDSLALSMLTLARMPTECLLAMTAQARQTCLEPAQNHRAVLGTTPTGAPT